jgi:hypothetical protein
MPCKFGGYLTYTKEDGSTEEIPWSYPDGWDAGEPVAAVTADPAKFKPALLLEEEVWQLVQEAYRAQGRGVPAEEAKACLLAIREAKKPKAPEPEREKTAEEILGPRPAWGDPMFWPWWNKAKALGLVKPKSPKQKKTKK